MIRTKFSVIILIIIITIFGFVFPFLSWIEERKIGTILQSFSILTVYFILFAQTAREKLKNKRSLTIGIQYLENLMAIIYHKYLNLIEKEKFTDIDDPDFNEFKNREEDLITAEISIFKDWYKEDLKKLHSFVRESDGLLTILIQLQENRYLINCKGIFKHKKGGNVENITLNLEEQKKLIKRLNQLIFFLF